MLRGGKSLRRRLLSSLGALGIDFLYRNSWVRSVAMGMKSVLDRGKVLLLDWKLGTTIEEPIENI